MTKAKAKAKAKNVGLVLDPKNAKRHSDRNKKAIRQSLESVGPFRSIGAVRGVVKVGNGVAEQAMQMGLKVKRVKADRETLVVVDRDDLTEAEADRAAMLDNIAADSSAFDYEAARFAELVNGDDLLKQMAAEEKRYADLLKGPPKEEPQDPAELLDKAAELQKKWQVKRGDVWTCGRHRLMCGDSTSKEDVARLMQGEKARLCFTSPPFANQRTYTIGEFDWQQLAQGFTKCMFDVMGNPSDVVVNLGLSYQDGKINAYWNEWLSYCESLGHSLYGWYVWDKGRGFPGEWNGRLAPAHEWLFHFSIGRVSANKWVEKTESSFERAKYVKRQIQRNRDGEIKAPYSRHAEAQPTKIPDSVLRIRVDSEGYGDHPAVFPVEFPEFGVKTWANCGDTVYEPFLGSGTTLVACEQTGRIGRGMEIEPKYCAVALERLANLGLSPERVTDGKAKRRKTGK